VQAQYILSNNLVPNPSFEDYTTCPDDISQISNAIPWKMPVGNFNPGSPDFLNYCSQNTIINNILNNNHPLNGNGCAGLFLFGNSTIQYPNYREYLEIELKSKMKKNNSYCSIFNSILSLYCGGAAIENIGMLITKTKTISNSSSPFITMIIDSIPQIKNRNGIITDTVNWTKISGVYEAKGNEQYITIGNFSRDSNTNLSIINGNWLAVYYLIDDVSVCECSFDINLGADTSLCEGESLILNPMLPNASYTWQDSSHAATFEVKQPGTYWVRAFVADYDITTTDTIVITAGDDSFCNPPLTIPNIITPNGDSQNDNFVLPNAEYYDIALQIYNRWGVIIYESVSYKNDFSCKECADGVYYYVLIAKSKRNGREKEYKGSLTVING
jgi:gliding motility-associated-like protein